VSILFQPQRLGRIEIQNRLIRSATYYGLADPKGRVGDASVELMKTLASGGVGLIVTGFAYVSPNGQVFGDMNGIDSDEQIAGYRRMTAAVHQFDGKVIMQIVHAGFVAGMANRRGEPRLFVSAAEGESSPESGTREMTEEDIETIIDAFGQAARRVQEAGFDGVQIHGAHGYLVTQFLSPTTNRRTDRWGGSPENRMRFVVEVVRAMRARVDEDFPVMIKLGCRDHLDEGGGMTIEEGASVAAVLEREGVCFVEVSHGMDGRAFRKLARPKGKAPRQEAYLLPDARVVRGSTSGPLAVVGGMRSLPVMEEAIESGAVDCVALCRPLIREPDLIRRWMSGDTSPSQCKSCGACMKVSEDGTSEIRCRQLRPDPS
jgi:2,4-dienoyl-CoA reductase-like NADH-dependent reductase (Old Yellow Enzyme family)